MLGICRNRSLAFLVFMLVGYPGIATAQDFISRDYRVGHLPILALVHDFNGDGKSDLAVLNTGSGSVSILLGNGDGKFQSAKDFDVGGPNPTSISVADFNRDGKLDLAIGGLVVPGQPTCGASAVNVLLGNGDGSFQPPHQAISVNLLSSLAASGDVNGDGKQDLIVETLGPSVDFCEAPGLMVFLGNGDGTFQTPKLITGKVVDIDGDGIADLVVSSGFSGPLNIFLGQGNGRFKPLTSNPENNSGVFTVEDFNTDQKQDQVSVESIRCSGLFCEGGTTYIAVALGKGDGTFESPQLVPPDGYHFPGTPIMTMSPSDFNGDGKPDLAFINAGTPGFHVFLGKGDGSFPSQYDFNTGSGPGSFIVADLNGDHLPELVMVNLNDDSISVVLNTSPTSGADLSVQISATPEPISVTQNLTYMVQVANAGPKDVTDVVLNNTLPTDVIFSSATSTQGSCTQASLVVTCSISKLVSGDSATVTLVVVPSATGSVTDTASVTGTESDPIPANNIATHSTHVDPLFALKVTKSGAGAGAVAATGITCGSTCSNSFPTGTIVTIQAQPAAGSVFGGWSGDCSSSLVNTTCGLTMDADKATIATFDIGPNFFLSIDATTLGLKRGSSTTTNISILPEGNSFDSAVTLTCTITGPAPMPACSFSPASVTPGANQVGSIFTVAAPVPAVALIPARTGSFESVVSVARLPMLAIVLVGFALRPRKSVLRRRNCSLALLFLVLIVALQSACGGGGSVPHPPVAQTYTVTVTAASGAIHHSSQISVTVN